MFSNVYENKRVLITGHTGFKGTWLTSWLLKLGANLCGVSDKIPTKPSMFEVLQLERKIEHHLCDIRELESLREIVHGYQPDFLFHMAAQPIVSLSYEDPLETISTNVIGTANILEVLRSMANDCVAIFITSDKCYENVEWEWGYKETDHLGGKDIYSGSKGAAEVIFHAYQKSFFNSDNFNIKLSTVRAGNVIGGGDWAKDRIVVDCMTKWSKGETVELRSPAATRPWQHVLEPLSGYLTLGAKLCLSSGESLRNLHGGSYNFGPKSEQNRTVLDIMKDLSEYWEFAEEFQAYTITDNIPFHEAGLLKLNCDKALFHLKWEANLNYKECVDLVSKWYVSFYKDECNMFNLTMNQIEKYENRAKTQGLVWCK